MADDGLLRIAQRLESCRDEFRRIVNQSSATSAMAFHAQREAVKACRNVLLAMDKGAISGEVPNLSGGRPQRLEGAEWVRKFLGIEASKHWINELSDDSLFVAWRWYVGSFIHQCGPAHAFKGDTGRFDFPHLKRDDAGRLVDSNGKPLEYEEFVDPETNSPGYRALSAPADETDDHSDNDWLEHSRGQIADWADVCDAAVEMIQRHVSELGPGRASQAAFDGDQEAETGKRTDAIECHVTLSQMAAIVNKSKRTLERLRDNGRLSAPAVKGPKGTAHEWRWSDVRPILEDEYRRKLPETFPADRFVRR